MNEYPVYIWILASFGFLCWFVLLGTVIWVIVTPGRGKINANPCPKVPRPGPLEPSRGTHLELR